MAANTHEMELGDKAPRAAQGLTVRVCRPLFRRPTLTQRQPLKSSSARASIPAGSAARTRGEEAAEDHGHGLSVAGKRLGRRLPLQGDGVTNACVRHLRKWGLQVRMGVRECV